MGGQKIPKNVGHHLCTFPKPDSESDFLIGRGQLQIRGGNFKTIDHVTILIPYKDCLLTFTSVNEIVSQISMFGILDNNIQRMAHGLGANPKEVDNIFMFAYSFHNLNFFD